MIEPAYQGLEADDVTLLSSADGGALVRIIAGDVAGHRGPGSTHTPMAFMHASIAPGALLELPWDPGFNALVYLLAGSGRVGSDGRPVTSGQLVTFGAGDFISLRADDDAAGRDGPPRGADPRGPAHQRAGRALRALRHEHEGRNRPGARGLRGGPAGDHPAQRAHAARARPRPRAHRALRHLNPREPRRMPAPCVC